MKHIYYVFLIGLFLGTTHVAVAQITFTESFFLAKYGTTETSTFFDLDDSMDMTALVNATGPNQTWDFSGFSVVESGTISQAYIQLPADLPGADLFPDSDFAIQLQADTISSELGDSVAFYLYSSFEDGYFFSNGGITVGDIDEDGENDLVVTTFTPPSKDNPIPLTYEAAWEDSSSTTLSVGEFEFPATSADLTSSVVDGWGTLITPQGSFQALRIKTDFSTESFLGGGVVFTHTDIDFITLEGVFASLFIDENGEVDASLTVLEGSMTGTPVEDEVAVPEAYQLSQNYPNPFNPSTTIRYQLPATSEVKLTVYTLTGQEITTLVNATQTPGPYEVQFDGATLSSGIYMYRLETESFSETRMMSLIK